MNDVPRDLSPAPATWGDLLDQLDAEAARAGVVLSAARFDGVDEPSFREPEMTSRTLGGMTRIEVEMATPRALLHACLVAAAEPLEDAARDAVALAAEYRQFDVSAGHSGLVELCASLRQIATLIGLLDGGMGIDIGEAGLAEATVERQLASLNAVLQSVIAAQESFDWLTVADILEYDLEPLVRQWADLFRTLTQDSR